MKKIKKILICVFIFAFFAHGLYAKGTLNVKVTIIPAERVKKYSHGDTLLFDAGSLNSNDPLVQDIELATVTVDMSTEQTNGGSESDLPGITGDFSNVYILDNLLQDKIVELGNRIEYRGGNLADIELYISNVNIQQKQLNVNVPGSNKYMFIAYPEELNVNPLNVQGLQRLLYSFKLYLKVSGAQSGDIIRKDVTTTITGPNLPEGTPIGRIQDIIAWQFRNIEG